MEARRSIVLQIRASVSIIMAVIKCSVFQSNAMLQMEPQRVKLAPAQLFTGFGCSAPPIKTTTSTGNNKNNLDANNGARQRDNQFDYHYLPSCQSAFGAEYAILQLGSSNWLAKFQEEQQLQSITSAYGNANAIPSNCYIPAPSAGLQQHRPEGEFNIASNMNSQQQQQQQQTGNKMNLNEPIERSSSLQIMNYFLQTWNGTQSAHTAINKLLVSCGLPSLEHDDLSV